MSEIIQSAIMNSLVQSSGGKSRHALLQDLHSLGAVGIDEALHALVEDCAIYVNEGKYFTL